MTFDQMVRTAAAGKASDIHLRAGHAPLVRVNGALQRWASVAPVSAADLEAIALRLLPPAHQERLVKHLEVDVAWQAPGVGRCRASVFRQRGTVAVSMRLIPDKIPSLESLGLPPSVIELAKETRGLVLVTGVTGSGKSTTLAAIIDLINRTRPEHILTIEDPIEFVHADARAVVTQREIGFDTPSYPSGLRSALRQDPDVILIGEMRDPETIETALVAAETGHLVFSTLHTLDAPETVNRIIAAFPPHQQGQIRQQLTRVLKAAVSQRLLPRADGQGRALAAEVLIATPYIRDCIDDPDKTGLIADAIAQGGSQYGMQTFDQAILKLYERGLVTMEEALRWVTNVEEFKMRLRGITTGTAAAIAGGSPDIERYGS
ncbi:MAG TPA: type IV pilus twitching motility protein PilT [Vicinamibacterales bacterium]|nr:type IV pilus twitching motility protein PilT [Vicinamibacterales bacterium]